VTIQVSDALRELYRLSTTKPEIVIAEVLRDTKDVQPAKPSFFCDVQADGTLTDYKFCLVLHEFSLTGSMVTTKAEVVITKCRLEI